MVLLFFISFIMEDSLVPSLRLSALGSDFTLLIEDPLTDVQFNPAKLGNLVSPSIYFSPEWTSYYPGGGKVNAVLLYPKVLHHICLGLLSSYGYSKQHFIYVYEYGDSDTASYLDSYPSVSFAIAFPFLKEEGFFGISGTVKKPTDKYTRKTQYMSFDSSFHNSDTSFYHNESRSFYQDINKTTLWSIRGGQYLPFESSAINVVFAITHSKPEVSSGDSSFYASTNMDIDHYDSIRTMYYSYRINEGHQISKENYDVWQYNLGFVWEKDIHQGHMRFFCRGGLDHGEITQQEILREWEFSEYRYEYISPDSTYSFVDTNVCEDIDEDITGSGDIVGDNEEIGIGFEKSIHDNANFLTGLKICRTRNEMKRTTLDNVKTIETDYRAIVPVGGEFFVTTKVIVRGGITLSYTNHSEEEIISESTKFTDSYIDITHSFGLGVNLTPHFKFDLYNDGYDLANIHNWRIEGIYCF